MPKLLFGHGRLRNFVSPPAGAIRETPVSRMAFPIGVWERGDERPSSRRSRKLGTGTASINSSYSAQLYYFMVDNGFIALFISCNLGHPFRWVRLAGRECCRDLGRPRRHGIRLHPGRSFGSLVGLPRRPSRRRPLHPHGQRPEHRRPVRHPDVRCLGLLRSVQHGVAANGNVRRGSRAGGRRLVPTGPAQAAAALPRPQPPAAPRKPPWPRLAARCSWCWVRGRPVWSASFPGCRSVW